MSRTAHTPCDYISDDGRQCDRSPVNGDVLYRMNPKGEAGIFMCEEHAAQIEREDRR